MSVLARSVTDIMKSHPHPWRVLRDDWPHVDLHYATLPDGTWGLSDGHTIWLDEGLSQAERRCTLMHELVHLERGEHSCQDEATEEAVHALVARRLIPWALLASAVVWAEDILELADELWVDVETVEARLAHLHPSERIQLVEILNAKGSAA